MCVPLEQPLPGKMRYRDSRQILISPGLSILTQGREEREEFSFLPLFPVGGWSSGAGACANSEIETTAPVPLRELHIHAEAA